VTTPSTDARLSLQPRPAEAAPRIRVVVEAADRCEAPAAAEVPLLDLFVPIFDVGAVSPGRLGNGNWPGDLTVAGDQRTPSFPGNDA